jgi:hypothetical protein
VLGKIKSRLTYANVMATIAVFAVLGGGAYAAFHLPKNSVKSRHIKNGQVKKQDLAKPQPFKSAGLAAFTGDCADTPDQWADVMPEPGGFVGYYRDLEGRVHLRGTAVQCNPPGITDAFVLPKGFRPALGEGQVGLRNHVGVEIDVRGGNGVVSASGATGDIFSLDGISFRCGPSGQNGCP